MTEYAYNGWPASGDPDAIGVDSGFIVNGLEFPGGMKGGDVSTVMAYLINALDTRVEAGRPGWCWGYSYRANVNNPSELSCHAAAAAADWMAPNHPNGTSTGPDGGGGWSGAQYAEIHRILDELEGSVRWLESNDPMHFEILADAATLAGVAGRIGKVDDDMTPDECRQVVRDELVQFFTRDVVKVLGDEMSDPSDYDSTRDKIDGRTLRLVSITGAEVTGRQ